MVSPIIGNLYLHEVLDTWYEFVVKPRLKGRAFMIRYADDAVPAFERREDAERVMEVLPKAVCQIWPEAPPGEDSPFVLPETLDESGRC